MTDILNQGAARGDRGIPRSYLSRAVADRLVQTEGITVNKDNRFKATEQPHEDDMTERDRDRRIVAEVIDRLIQHDIDKRGIRGTFKHDVLSIAAYRLAEFTTALRLDADGDDVDLLKRSVLAVDAGEDGQHELRKEQPR